ncbi:unknown [Brachyspira sp. CAG:700]|nr:unknown [Brachyspira sp. CAG:700]
MKNLKNLIIILFFLSLFHICCKSNSNPITLSYYAGKWHNVEDDTLVITIYSDGSMSDSSDKKILASEITRISATSYKTKQGDALYFRSFTKGTFTPQGAENPTIITRK